MNYYRRYVGDYLRDTSRLSMLEHGAYNLLLDYYYAEERPVSLDIGEVYRMVRAMMPEERRAIDKVLTTFFYKTEDGHRHKRVDEEITIASKMIEVARENGKLGGRPRINGTDRLTETVTATVTETITGLVSVAEPVNNHPPTTILQPPAAIPQPPLTLTPANAGEARPSVPPCPHAEIVRLYGEHLPMGTQVKPPWKGTRSTHLQARWREDRSRQDLDWWDQFFAYCSKSAFLTGQKPSRKPGDRPFRISIDWILEPTNFQKIIEGTYDD